MTFMGHSCCGCWVLIFDYVNFSVHYSAKSTFHLDNNFANVVSTGKAGESLR